MTNARVRGFTLMEMLIAMMILAIIITLAVPSLSGFTANQRLIGAAEQVYSHLQQGRSEAVGRNRPVRINFAVDGTASWAYGMSSANDLCDLTVTDATAAGACAISVDDGDGALDPGDGSVDTDDLLLMRFTDLDFPGVQMDIDGFSSGSTQITFDPLRGTATAGEVRLTGANGNKLYVRVSLLGRVTICTPDDSMGAYQAC